MSQLRILVRSGTIYVSQSSVGTNPDDFREGRDVRLLRRISSPVWDKMH